MRCGFSLNMAFLDVAFPSEPPLAVTCIKLQHTAGFPKATCHNWPEIVLGALRTYSYYMLILNLQGR